MNPENSQSMVSQPNLIGRDAETPLVGSQSGLAGDVVRDDIEDHVIVEQAAADVVKRRQRFVETSLVNQRARVQQNRFAGRLIAPIQSVIAVEELKVTNQLQT